MDYRKDRKHFCHELRDRIYWDILESNLGDYYRHVEQLATACYWSFMNYVSWENKAGGLSWVPLRFMDSTYGMIPLLKDTYHLVKSQRFISSIKNFALFHELLQEAREDGSAGLTARINSHRRRG